MDETAEWRSFGDGDDGKTDMNRVGGKTNPFLSNSGLDTSIKGTNAALYAKWQTKSSYCSMTSKDKSFLSGMSYLQDLCSRLNVIEATFKKACEILKKVDDMELVKGSRLNTRCATILFMACRVTQSKMDVKDILMACNIGHKDLSKCFKKIKPALPGQQLSASSAQCAEDAAQKMGLDSAVVDVCRQTAENISKLEVLTGKKPATIAGVAIFMITQLSPELSSKFDCASISNILGMGEAAIRGSFREVEDL